MSSKLGRSGEQELGHLADVAQAKGRQTREGFEDPIKKGVRTGEQELGHIANTATNSFGKVTTESDKMRKGTSDNFSSLNATINSGLRNIGENTNKMLKSFGVKEMSFSINDRPNDSVGGHHTSQRGSIIPVPGYGEGDKVRALLEPGEVVVNKKAVAAMGGPQHVNRINEIIPRFQQGGQARGGSAAGGLDFAMGPYTVPPIQYDAGHAGGNSHVHISGTTIPWVIAIGRQLQQMGNDVGEFGGPASAGFGPITTTRHAHYLHDHYSGFAIDVNNATENQAWVASIARILGGNGVAGIAGAVVEKLKREVIDGPAGPLKNMGQKALDKVRRAADKFIATKAPAEATGSGSMAFANIAGQGSELMRNISKQKGWNFDDWWSIDAIESGHGTNLVNPTSTARLRGQFLDFNWGKYGPGSDPGPAPGTNPQLWPPMDEQIKSMAAYIAERYGNPSAAWAWHQSHNWYKKGGVVLSGDSLGEGMRDNAGFPSGWNLDVVGGRGSAAGAAKVAGLIDKYDPLALVFEHGSNDDGGAAMKGALKKVGKAVGDDLGLALMNTANNPAANKVIEGFNRMDALADWNAIAGDYGTGLHPPPKGYVAMRDIVKKAAKDAKAARKGPGAAGGSDDDPGGEDESSPLDSPWAQAFVENYIPPKIKENLKAYQGAIDLLKPEIMLAEFMHSFASSEAGSSRGPLETATELFLNQQYLTNLEGKAKWLKKGIEHKGTAKKARRAMRTQLAELEGDADNIGLILETKKLIDELQHPEFDTDLTEGQEFLLEYYKSELVKANQRTAVSQAQYQVFRDFAGGFAGGGYIPMGQFGLVGEQGPEVISGPNTVSPMGEGSGVTVVVNGDIVNTPPGMQPVEVRGAKTIVQQGSRGYGRRPLGGAKGY